MSKCTTCKEPVTWAALDGKRLPFESATGPPPHGNFVMLPREHGGPEAFAADYGYWNRHVHARKEQSVFAGSPHGRGRGRKR